MGDIINYAPPKNISNQMCRHYWRIEALDARKSKGVCKYCGEEREFTNSFEDILEEKKSKKGSNSMKTKSDKLPL